MNKKIFNKALGYYDSSFFRMHVATSERIERIETLSDEAYAILVHEYTHFIQDITTIHGLNNVFATIQYLKYASNMLYKTQGEFVIPIIPDYVDVNDFVYFNTLIADISNGDFEQYDNAEIIDYRPQKLPIDDRCAIKEMTVTQLEVRIDDSYNLKYIFGASCIYESMAYIMERNMAQFGVIESPDLPYCAAEKLVRLIYEEFAEDEMNILAVCDLSLNCSNPGKVFVEIINEWKQKGTVPDDPRELYDDFYKREFELTEATEFDKKVNTVNYLTHFEKYLKLVEKELYSYFRPTQLDSHDEFSYKMNLINKWISEVFATALKWRKKNPYFIIDIAEGGERYNNIAFISFYNEFGLPFCTNDSNDGCFYHPKFATNDLQLSYFSAVYQINNIFDGNLDICNLYCYCKKCERDESGEVTTDNRCSTPWIRCYDKKLCPVAAIWRHWKLSGYKPIIAKSF